MKTVKSLYEKNKQLVDNGLFVIILLVFPLLRVTQGLDFIDASYSLGNFEFFAHADGTWMVATFLANVVGWIFTCLPGGGTVIGMYVYTGLVISITGLVSYFFLRKRVTAPVAFAGEMLALALCWCPSSILYNYLTYLFVNLGIIFLIKGILTEQKKYYFIIAGIFLGLNVAVRMPNVTQMAYILVLWIAAIIKKRKPADTVKDTLLCIIGYVAGFGIPYIAICIKYGFGSYSDMVMTMFGMTDSAKDYKADAMALRMLGDYLTALYWLGFMAACLLLIYALRLMQRSYAPDILKGHERKVYLVITALATAVIIRFYWGRGVFSFRYYEYGSMYYWAAFFVVISVVCYVLVFIKIKRKEKLKPFNQDSRIDGPTSFDDKVIACALLAEVFITPLGSNNGFFPIVNNLFLIAPFTFYLVYKWVIRTKHMEASYPLKTVAAMFAAMLLVQSFGFHFGFIYNDGDDGSARSAKIELESKAKGIHTSEKNASEYENILNYAEAGGLIGRKVILYDEIPGLSYYLDMPPAISTSWPDLKSYPYDRFVSDMADVESNMADDRPVVIVSSEIAAYLSGDDKACEWYGIDKTAYDGDRKVQLLQEFVDEYGYAVTYGSEKFTVYE